MEFKKDRVKPVSPENIVRPRDAFFQGIDSVFVKFEKEELHEDAAILMKVKDRYNQYLKGLLEEKKSIQEEEKYSTYSLDEFLGLVPHEGEKNYRSTDPMKEVPATIKWGGVGGMLFDTVLGRYVLRTADDIQSALKEHKKLGAVFYSGMYEPISNRFSQKAEEIFLKTLGVIPSDVTFDRIDEYINQKIRDDQMKDITYTRAYYPNAVSKDDYRVILRTNIPGVAVRLFHTESKEEGTRHEIYFRFKENFLKKELATIINEF
jgi:hypothetical protein